MKDRKKAVMERLTRRKELLRRIIGRTTPKSDVDGSYTGMSEDGSPPVQDADDL